MLTYTDKEWVITNGQRPCQFLNSTYIVITLLIILPAPGSAIFWSISVFYYYDCCYHYYDCCYYYYHHYSCCIFSKILFFISFTYIFSLFCNVTYQILMSTNKTLLCTILCRSNTFEIWSTRFHTIISVLNTTWTAVKEGLKWTIQFFSLLFHFCLP